MGEQRVIYDNFGKGEFGHLGATRAPDNSYTGRNVMVYRNGLIGPRPGMKATGVSTTGTISNIWWARGAVNTDLWWVTSTGAVKKVNLSNGTVTTLTGATGAPNASYPPQAVDAGLGIYYLTVCGDGTYKVDLTANTVTAVADVIGGIDIAIYGDRLYVANDAVAGDYFNIYYSDAADFDTFGATSFFSVGNHVGISALEGQRDHLAILMQDGAWWTYRGTGSTATLRKITAGGWYPWVIGANSACKLTDDTMLFLAQVGDWPITFNGSILEHHLGAGPEGDERPYSTAAGVRCLPGRRPGEALVIRPDDTNGVLFYSFMDGAWSLFSSQEDVSAFAASSGEGLYVLTDYDAPSFTYLDLRVDRPAFTSDTYARPGDLTDTPLDAYFYLPEFWSPPGTEVLVKQVIVDFVAYETGVSGDDAGFALSLTTFGGYDNPGTETPAAQSWSGTGSTTGTKRREVFNVGDQGWGPGFQAGLTAIKGVAIKSITVVVDTQPSVPRV